ESVCYSSRPFGVARGMRLRGIRIFVAAGCAVAIVAAWSVGVRGQAGARPGPGREQASTAPTADPSLTQQYCQTCHNNRLKTGGLSLEGMSPTDAAAHTDVWEKVVLKLRGGMMPPQGMPRPDQATLERFTVNLEQTLNRAALAAPDPGHKPVHRLNRTEYGNAIRDLLDLDVDVA